jgi:sugar phosphate isomerase/epimerase
MGAQVVQIADNLPIDSSALASMGRAATGITLELGTRGTKPENLLRYLEYAALLGSPLVRSLPDADCNEENLREVLPEFARHGVLLALENYEHMPSAELASLVRRLNNPWVGICLDTANSLGTLEAPEYTFRILAPYTVSVHVKDFDIVRVPHMMGFEVVGRPAGRGRLDVRSLVEQVRAHGQDPNLIIEQWPPFSGSLEETISLEAAWAEDGLEYVKSITAPAKRVA